MARIPDNELERLKSEVSVQRLVEASGVELKRGGKDWLGRCPFHEDDTASLVLSPAKSLWHCFGCGAAGGPIDWVMKTRGVSFRHAVELLREALPSSAADQADSATPIKRATMRALPPPVAFDVDDAQLLGWVQYCSDTRKSVILRPRPHFTDGIDGQNPQVAPQAVGCCPPEPHRVSRRPVGLSQAGVA